MNQKERFDQKILEMKGEQAKNVKMFSEEEYKEKIQRIKEVRMPGHTSLLLRGYNDLSPAVGHVRECPHSGTRYLIHQPLSNAYTSLSF